MDGSCRVSELEQEAILLTHGISVVSTKIPPMDVWDCLKGAQRGCVGDIIMADRFGVIDVL